MGNVELSRRGNVATVRLNRPPVNALSREMMRELHDCFAGLAHDREIGAVVLTAVGDRVFCAGLDLGQRLSELDAQAVPVDATERIDPGKLWRETQGLVRHLPVPVVAAVEGAAVGGGFGLVGVCDVIFAAERATFKLTEIDVGLLGGASKAIRMLGPYKARSMYFTGDALPASELYRLGAVEAVVPNGEAEAAAHAFAERVAAKSPIGMRLAKEAIVRIEHLDVETGYRVEQDYTRRLSSYNDSAEAMRSFREKRPPVWTWT